MQAYTSKEMCDDALSVFVEVFCQLIKRQRGIIIFCPDSLKYSKAWGTILFSIIWSILIFFPILWGIYFIFVIKLGLFLFT